MLDSTVGRWLIGTIVVFAVIALIAWARNDAGVDDRDPDPPSPVVIVVPQSPAPTVVDTDPPTT